MCFTEGTNLPVKWRVNESQAVRGFVCLSSDVTATGTVCVPEFRCDSDRHCLCA